MNGHLFRLSSFQLSPSKCLTTGSFLSTLESRYRLRGQWLVDQLDRHMRSSSLREAFSSKDWLSDPGKTFCGCDLVTFVQLFTIFYEVPMIFLPISYIFLKNFLWISFTFCTKFLMDFLQLSYKFLQISYHYLILSIVQISNKFLMKFLHFCKILFYISSKYFTKFKNKFL